MPLGNCRTQLSLQFNNNLSMFKISVNKIQRLSKQIRYKSSLDLLLNQIPYVWVTYMSCALSGMHLQTLNFSDYLWQAHKPKFAGHKRHLSLHIPPNKIFSPNVEVEEKKVKKQSNWKAHLVCIAKNSHSPIPVHQKQILSNTTS
jgi:hypothetical protein